jgi:signal transduction histidine kinase
MNRRILLQVAAPALVIGLFLFGACLLSAWYIERLQMDLSHILSQNVSSLRAAQQLEIHLRQLRFHCFLYLIAPEDEMLERINKDQQNFEGCLEDVRRCLQDAQRSAHTPEEHAYVDAIAKDLAAIEIGYATYRREFERLRAAAPQSGPHRDFQELSERNPVRHVIEPCHDLLDVNDSMMAETVAQSDRVGRRLRLALLFLGLAGPVSGLIIGYGVARGLSRSIYQLSVRVQDMARRLDQDVASVSVAAEGDIPALDKQLRHVVQRVEEVAERLQRQQRDLLRAEQLSAVGQLAASVAHEVRNPLTSVKLLVEAALRAHKRKPLTVDDLQVIHGEIGRLEQTVQHFLDFARPPTLQRHVCDLREVVVQAAALVGVRARQQEVEMAIRCGDRPVSGNVDRDQLCTVLVNLFLNALDAMPHGGRLEADLELSPAAEILLRVSDSGSGILPELAGRLFTPFASSKPTGTGLGLSISRRIVEEHGGTLTGENRPGGGAVFMIRLPAVPQGTAVSSRELGVRIQGSEIRSQESGVSS